MFRKNAYNTVIKTNKGENMHGRPSTLRVKTSLINHWVIPYLKQDGSNLDQAIGVWESNLEPNSVKSVLYAAKGWVKEQTGVELNIKAHIKRVARSTQQEEASAFTKEEIVRLSATCEAEDPELFLPVMIALHTGLRRGEVWGLLWDDVDMLKRQIKVSRSYDGPTKSGKSRIVPISKKLNEVLLAQKKNKAYNIESSRIINKEFDPNPRLREVCKLAGIRETFTFHSLRHTFATLALESGASPRLVSKQLGHASTSTTINLYWSCTQEHLDVGFLND